MPEENRFRYGRLKFISEQYDRLGNLLGGIGHYANAHEAYSFSKVYKDLANELRVDIK